MTRFSKSALLLGAALAVLSACSGGKGPGEIGTKNDIVVRNNGLPGTQKAPAPNADFSSSVEQAEAGPAPSVETAQALPDPSPAIDAAAQQVADAKAPLASTATTTPVTTPSTEGNRIDQVVPAVPVQDAANIPAPEAVYASAPAPAPETIPVQPYAAPAAPAPAPAVAPTIAPAPAVASPSSVYPAADYTAAGVTPPGTAPAAPVAPAPVAPPVPSANAYVPVPAGTAYPLDPNAPYSPKAMAGVATTTAVAAPVAAGGVNYADPSIIRAAQTALAAKGAYTGAATGTVDAAFLNALVVYQSQNNLPVGALNEETLRNLGVVQ